MRFPTRRPCWRWPLAEIDRAEYSSPQLQGPGPNNRKNSAPGPNFSFYPRPNTGAEFEKTVNLAGKYWFLNTKGISIDTDINF